MPGIGQQCTMFRVSPDQADAGFPELVASLNQYRGFVLLPQIGPIWDLHEPSPKAVRFGQQCTMFRVLPHQADAGFPELVASLNQYRWICFVAANRSDSHES
jgi:hypothetical protein